MRRQSLSLPNMFSTLWRCLYKVLEKVCMTLRPLRAGKHGSMPLALSVARYARLNLYIFRTSRRHNRDP